MKRFIFAIFVILLFTACSIKTPLSSKAINFMVISPIVRFSDAGFMHKYLNETNIQIYNSGVNILNLIIKKDKICMNGACEDELVFNEKFFKMQHYRGILNQILNMSQIYNGINLQKTDCGFSQNISKYFIKYEKCNNSVNFIDSKNGIKIILKELD